MTAAEPPLILRTGPATPVSPVVLTVPHAGRQYGERLLRMTRLPQTALATLEDRYADRLVERAVTEGAVALVATTARAWIDLNRDPRELDPAMIEPPPPAAQLRESAKLRGGLGLIPRRIARGGDIWRDRLGPAEIAARIEAVHAPWHAAIDLALAAAHARFGQAVLIDCHSMPALPGEPPPRLVLGDCHGRSATPAIRHAMAGAARPWALGIAHNSPYAGGYTLERHGRPQQGIHAVQIELCRSLYLDERHDRPGPGFDSAGRLVAALAAAAATAALDCVPPAIAAE